MGKPAPIEGLDHDSTLDEAARRSITARLGDVRKYEEALGSGVDPDDVHDMRVASRRLRAALSLFDRKEQLRPAHDAVETLGDALGEVREAHVQLGWLREAVRQAGDKDRPGIEALLGEREAKLPKRVDKLRAALADWQRDGVGLVEGALATLSLRGRLGGRRVRQRMGEHLKEVKKRLAAAARSGDARSAHRLRIGAKKLRYAAELAQPAFPSDMEALLDRLQPLQETLGELHDADVHIPIVEKYMVRADGAGQPGALALLRAEMERREQQAAVLGETLRQFRDERILEDLRDALC